MTTTPRDDIGLSERLRKTLGGIAPKDFGGDNLAVFIASELEPLIEDETLDDSGTWKQGAIDACDRVLDAVHAHYAAQLDAQAARVKELEGTTAQALARMMDAQMKIGAYQGYATGAEARAKDMEARALRAEQERDALEKTARRHEQTLKDNGIGSHTEAVVLVVDLRRKLKLAQQQRDEAHARAANVCDAYATRLRVEAHQLPEGDRERSNLIAAAVEVRIVEKAIRRLAAGDEEGK